MRDIDTGFFMSGIATTSLLVVILTALQILLGSFAPTLESFVLTLAIMNFLFILGALVVSATSWTEDSMRNAYFICVILILIAITIYNLAVGGVSGLWNGATPATARASLISWLVNIGLTFGIAAGVYYVRIKVFNK